MLSTEILRALIWLGFAAVLTLLGVGLKKLDTYLEKRGASKVWRSTVAGLGELASIIVRGMQQTVVAPAKDPRVTSAVWTRDVAVKVKENATADLKVIGARGIATLRDLGMGDTAIDTLMSNLVEGAVFDLKQHAPSTVVANVSSSPPSATVTVTGSGAEATPDTTPSPVVISS